MLLEVDNFFQALQAEEGYAEKTCKAYASDLRRFLRFLEEKLKRTPQIADFEADPISEYLQFERTAGLKISTLRRRVATLRRFARYLLESGLVDRDPTQQMDFPVFTAQQGRKRKSNAITLRPHEVAKIDWAMAGGQNARALRDRAIFSLLLETGLSVAALVSIDLSDIKFPEQRVSVSNASGKLMWLHIRRSSDLLEQYLIRGRPDLTQSKTEAALFVSQVGGRLSRQAVWQALRKWGREASVSKDVTPRVVRNTSALQMARSGYTIRNIQASLGHRNPFSTRALLRRLKANA